jgi:hypothetical protein
MALSKSERIEPGTDDHLVERAAICRRIGWIGTWTMPNELGEHVVIYLQPQHWLSADLGEL